MRLLLNLGADSGGRFRLRGKEVTRLECFSDCVFALALTMMVVSAEVPRTWTDLQATLPQFFGFALCFAMFVLLWHRHAVFFRRYGLQDATTVVLNSALLLVALYFVYPLKFLTNTMVAVAVAFVSGGEPTVRVGGADVKPIAIADLPSLLALYLAGIAAILALFALLHRHALRRLRGELDDEEQRLTVMAVQESGLGAAVLAGTAVVCLCCGHALGALAPLPVLLLLPARLWLRRRRPAAKQPTT